MLVNLVTLFSKCCILATSRVRSGQSGILIIGLLNDNRVTMLNADVAEEIDLLTTKIDRMTDLKTTCGQK